MEIIYKKIKEIKPYENNPRMNDEAVKYVANSIKDFGFNVPIVIDKNNVIIAGHTRYKASVELGLEEVPTIRVDDLNEKQIKAFRIADNKVAERAEWNFELLDEEIKKILEENENYELLDEEINLDLYGFELQVFEDIIDSIDLSYSSDYKIYVKSNNLEEIEKAKKIVLEIENGNNL